MIEKIDKEIRILIVEDQPVCRLGIRMTLSGSDIKHRILSEAENVAQAVDFLEKHGKDIDLVLLDYVLPDGTGMDVIAAVKRLHLDVKIVILSGEAGGAILKQLMDAGVNGFMSKSVNPEEIAVVLNSVMQGHDYTGEGLMRIEDDLKADYETMKSLTRREMELVTLCANGLNAKQIAEEMNVTPHSVENMKSTIFAKVGVKSTNELILYAFRVGLIS
ncbi:MAG: response regulator transcription factor [Bacteroidales bacterium]|nr:response regulator transcription factor [Bacteroidales bacterium]